MHRCLVAGLMIMVTPLQAAPVRELPPVFQSSSSKSVDELAGCIALRLTEARGFEVRNQKRDKGVDFELKMRSAGIAITNSVITIEDVGSSRLVSYHFNNHRPLTPKPIGAPLSQCL